MRSFKRLINVCFLLTFIQQSFGQVATSDTTDLTLLSLEDLMRNKSQGIPSAMEEVINSSVEVATITPLVVRKSPNIVSIISEDEIRKSGARDLIDVLRLVPGIDFGMDVEGVIGIAIRGNWAHEAKVLMQINGTSLNETVYGTLQFANRYPMDQIKRIEIIRGPGSVIYGGEAEYAVINIITKNAEDLNGVQVNGFYGTMENALESNNYTLAVGKKINDFSFSLSNYFAKGNRSDQPYTDIFGDGYSMVDNSGMKAMNFILSMNYKSLTIDGYYDKFNADTRDAFDAILSKPYDEQFTLMRVGVKYDWKVSDRLMITPKISFKRSNPWEVSSLTNDDESGEVAYKTIADRYRGNITAIWNVTKGTSFTLGTEGFYDLGEKFDGDVFRNSGKAKVKYFNSSVFGQVINKNNIANLTIGGRFDNNSVFGSAFVPRIGLTKRFEKLNFKLLYSNSFKAPVIENVETSLSECITPEHTSILEFEPSYQINKDMFITLNLFDITTKNTIVYVVDTSISAGIPDGYINSSESGSRGFELEYKFLQKFGYLNIAYSYFTNAGKKIVDQYSSGVDYDHVLAFAQHKVSLSSSINLGENAYISPSVIFFSHKHGIDSIDEEGNYTYKIYPAITYINLFVGHNNFFVKNLQAGIGVYDLLNQKTQFIQPYASGHAPLPGTSREIAVRLTYNANFK